MEANDLRLNLADLYIQLGTYQQALQIIATTEPLTFQSILGIVKIALAKVCRSIKYQCFELNKLKRR